MTDSAEDLGNVPAPEAAIARLAAGVADVFERCLREVEESALQIDALLSPGSAVRQEVAEIRMACGQGGRFVWQLREIARRAASGAETVAVLNRALARMCGSHGPDEHPKGRSSEDRLLLMLGEHAGALAHRFNNLFTVIRGNSELMMTDLPSDHRARTPLAVLNRAVDEAGRLTLRLSGFGCRRILQPQMVDLRDLQSVYDETSGLQATSSAVEWILPENRVQVLADRSALVMMLGEVLENARALGPSVAIRVAVDVEELDGEAASSSERSRESGEYAAIRVIDAGRGFAPEMLQNLFQPFAAPAGGTGGLGLANVYGLARQMGGDVRVKSQPGSGSEVRIYLPLAAAGMQAPKPSRIRPEILPHRELTILVVDDSAGVRTILRKLLGRWGYRVLEAEDGRDATEVAAAYDGRIDLMITDVVMPNFSGPEAFRRIAQQRPDMRVIFMSGYSDNTLSTHRLASDGEAILSKPITAVELARKVASLRYDDSAREHRVEHE